MASQTVPFITPEEYLAAERAAEYKSEYFDGQVYKMPAVKRWHSVIAGNLLRALKDPRWELHGSLMRLRIDAMNAYTYPDVSIIRGKPEFTGLGEDILLNPTVIIEVFPKSKFLHYQTIQSLREYLLVSQYERRVDLCTRLNDKDWRIESIDQTAGRVQVSSVAVELSFNQIYAGVNPA